MPVEYDEKDPYGTCDICGSSLFPVWFKEREREVVNGRMSYTGRVRDAVSHLECIGCMRDYPVDDTFDGPWEREA